MRKNKYQGLLHKSLLQNLNTDVKTHSEISVKNFYTNAPNLIVLTGVRSERFKQKVFYKRFYLPFNTLIKLNYFENVHFQHAKHETLMTLMKEGEKHIS